MRRVFRITALSVAIGLIAALSVAGSVTAQTGLELTYSIPDARAYAAKVSVSKEVIEAAGRFDECAERDADNPTAGDDPETPYDECDASQYEQRLNCPPSITYGPSRQIDVPAPQSPAAQQGKIEGTSGAGSADPAPPEASPILLNDLLTLGHLTNFIGIQESGGLSSKRYVDNSGRSEPRAHTESDGFSVNRAPYEERCYPALADGQFSGSSAKFSHFFSNSGQTPSTVHYSECVEDCNLVSDIHPDFPVGTARTATTIVKLTEVDGRLVAELLAVVKGLNFAGALLTAEEVVGYARFSSDGTAEGLQWTLISYADGVTVCGTPSNLQQGKPPTDCGDFSVGMSEPYYEASEDGRDLTLVVPGMVVAWNTQKDVTQETGAPCIPTPDPENPTEPVPTCPIVRPQTVHFAGVELRSSQDRTRPFSFTGSDFDLGPLDTFSALGTADYSLPVPPPPPPAEFGAERTVAVRQIVGSVLPAASIIGFAGFALLLLLFAWIRRFDWGASLFRIQPFKFFLWLHRAFVRT